MGNLELDIEVRAQADEVIRFLDERDTAQAQIV
jgi:hypothetical protein